MKKKIVSVILCAAMATTVLAGCGSSNTASTDAAAEETTEDVEAEATTEEAEDAEAAEGGNRCSRSYYCRTGSPDHGN